jgi:sodium/proline symporter
MTTLQLWSSIIAVTTLLIFIVAGRRASGAAVAGDDYLTGGRSYGILGITLSAFATSNTAFMYLGAVGAGYSQGLAVIWLILGYLLGELLFFQFFPATINRISHERNPLTIPEYIVSGLIRSEQRLPRRIAGMAVAIFMAVYLIAQFLGVGKTLAVTFELPQSWAVLCSGVLIVALAFAYCVRGGLGASIAANAWQGALMYLCCVFVVLWLLDKQGGFAAALQALRTSRPDLLNPLSGSVWHAALLVLIGGFVASFGSALGLPTLLTRIAVAKDAATAVAMKWGYLALTYSFWLLMSAVGLLLVPLLQSTGDPETVLLEFAKQGSPVVYGIILSGILAATLSTTDSAMLVGAAALSEDIRDASTVSENKRARLRRWAVLLFGATAVVITIVLVPLTNFNVFSLVLFALAGLAGAVGPAFLVTTLGWRSNQRALVGAVLSGLVVALGWAALGWSAQVSEALPAFVVSLLVHWFLSGRTRHGR